MISQHPNLTAFSKSDLWQQVLKTSQCAIVLQCRFFSACALSTASCPQSQFLALSLDPHFFFKVARKSHKPTLKEPQVRSTAISKT